MASILRPRSEILRKTRVQRRRWAVDDCRIDTHRQTSPFFVDGIPEIATGPWSATITIHVREFMHEPTRFERQQAETMAGTLIDVARMILRQKKP